MQAVSVSVTWILVCVTHRCESLSLLAVPQKSQT